MEIRPSLTVKLKGLSLLIMMPDQDKRGSKQSHPGQSRMHGHLSAGQHDL